MTEIKLLLKFARPKNIRLQDQTPDLNQLKLPIKKTKEVSCIFDLFKTRDIVWLFLLFDH